MLGKTLSSDEVERARHFHFDHLRQRYFIARSVLRLLLARYLETSPERILFAYGNRGKPQIKSSDIRFNVSHSGSFGLFALARNVDVGIDAEEFRSLPDCLSIAERFFCRAEADELRALPCGEREKAFLRCWTRKEAYLKAVGEGLSGSLDGFRVTLQQGEPARFVRDPEHHRPDARWILHDLSHCLPRHAAALACRSPESELHVRPLLEPAQFFC